jgi:hypothetical protein
MKLFKLNDDVIVSEVDKLQQMTAQTIEQAIHVGHLLQAKKDSLGHGQWIPWIENTLPITRQQVSKYLLLAGNEQILVSDGKSGLHLAGINDAVQVIRRAKGPEAKAEKARNAKPRKPVAPSKQFLDSAAKLLAQVDIATLHRWIDEFIAPLKDQAQDQVRAAPVDNTTAAGVQATEAVAKPSEPVPKQTITPAATQAAATSQSERAKHEPLTQAALASAPTDGIAGAELSFDQEFSRGRKVKVSGQGVAMCEAAISIEDSDGLIGVLRQANGQLQKFWAWKTPEGSLTHFYPKQFSAIQV